MTSDEYLRERGWERSDQDGDFWYREPDAFEPRTVPEAVTIQVRRDRDCAAFVAAYQDGIHVR